MVSRGGGASLLAAAALGLAAIAASGTAPPFSATLPPGSGRVVQGATLLCPAAPAPAPGLSTRLVVATTRPGDGEAVLAPLAAGGLPAPPPLRLDLATAVQTADLPGDRAVVVRASGPAAAGLRVTRTSRGTAGPQRGLSVDACSPPLTHAWFTGAATAAGQSSTLHLVNVDDSPAQVDVRALTAAGPVEPASSQGRTVGPGQQLDLPLEQVAPFEPALAVEVTATRGRVAASVREQRGLGAAAPGGVDAVPGTSGPAGQLVLPGVPGAAPGSALRGSRQSTSLVLAAPGPADATVRIEVLDATRRVTPVGLDAIAVAAGTVTTVDLTPALDPTSPASTIALQSAGGVPLLAGILVDAQAATGAVHETLHLAPAEPLAGAAVVPDAPGGTADVTTVLSLTADRAGAPPTRARVLVGAAAYEVDVPRDRVASLVVPAVAGAGAAQVAPDPAGPALVASAVVAERTADGPGLAASPVLGLAPLVRPAVVRLDPTVSLPGG